jgi:hypothetical protein
MPLENVCCSQNKCGLLETTKLLNFCITYSHTQYTRSVTLEATQLLNFHIYIYTYKQIHNIQVVATPQKLLDTLAPELSREEELYALSLVDLASSALGKDAGILVAGDAFLEPEAVARLALTVLTSGAVHAEGFFLVFPAGGGYCSCVV